MSKTLDQRSQEHQQNINQLSNELNQNEARKNQIIQLINENAGALKLIAQMMVERKENTPQEMTSKSVIEKATVVDTLPGTASKEPKEPLSGAREVAQDARERAKLEKSMEDEKMKALQQKSQK